MTGAARLMQALLVAALLAAPAAAPAQAPVAAVILDEQRLITDTAYGRRLIAGFEADRAALIAEGDALAAELAEEERALVDRRATLSPEEFRTIADAFDARVEEVRASQIGRERALMQVLEESRQAFFVAATPILAELARELGAVVILSPQAMLLAIGSEGNLAAADITDAAITRLDAVLGDGSAAPQPDSAPSAAPAAD
jgi:Skp family chaperone for outer membrane proteins